MESSRAGGFWTVCTSSHLAVFPEPSARVEESERVLPAGVDSSMAIFQESQARLCDACTVLYTYGAQQLSSYISESKRTAPPRMPAC